MTGQQVNFLGRDWRARNRPWRLLCLLSVSLLALGISGVQAVQARAGVAGLQRQIADREAQLARFTPPPAAAENTLALAADLASASQSAARLQAWLALLEQHAQPGVALQAIVLADGGQRANLQGEASTAEAAQAWLSGLRGDARLARAEVSRLRVSPGLQATAPVSFELGLSQP